MDANATELVRIFEADPELGAALDEGTRRAARRVVVDAIRLQRGSLGGLRTGARPSVTGWLVLEGIIGRVVRLAGRRSLELLGHGDLVQPWNAEHAETNLRPRTEWRVLEPARMAILDDQFTHIAARLPGVIPELVSRPIRQAETLALRLAIAQVPRLDVRILALLWHLSDRWGRVHRDGLHLPLRLSQGELAELVCAQRTSVTLSLKRLRTLDLVHAVGRNGWVLKGEAPDQLRSVTRAPDEIVIAAEALVDAADPAASPPAGAPIDDLVVDLRGEGARSAARLLRA